MKPQEHPLADHSTPYQVFDLGTRLCEALREGGLPGWVGLLVERWYLMVYLPRVE